MKRTLVDLQGSIRFQLTESVDGSGKHMIARGEFGRADVLTQNRRMYPRSIWQREINRISEAISQGKVFGHPSHPESGKTDLAKVSHIITSLHMQDDGVIIGEAKILDNEHGKQLRSIAEAGGSIGISSRGMGSTSMGEDGSEIVQEDYQYITHDFVADPAVLTSYPSFKTEAKQVKSETVMTEIHDKDFEVWIKTPFPSTTEVDKKFTTKAEAENHAKELKVKHPDWETWVDTTTNRNKMSKTFPEAGETDDTGYTESKDIVEMMSKLNPDEQRMAQYLDGHPDVLNKIRRSDNPLQAMGENDVQKKSGVDENAQVSYEDVLDHFGISIPTDAKNKNESEEKNMKKTEAKEKPQDSNKAPKAVKPNEVRSPEGKVEPAKIEVTTGQSPILAANADVKTEGTDTLGEHTITPDSEDLPKDQSLTVVESDDEFKELDKLQAELQAMTKANKPEDKEKKTELRKKVKLLFSKLYDIKTFTPATEIGKDDKSEAIQLENIDLKAKIEELGLVANRLGACLYMERKLTESKADRDDLVKIIGKPKLETVKQVDKILAEAKSKLEDVKEERKKVEAQTKLLEDKYKSRIIEAEEKTKKLEEALKSTVQYSKEIGMRLYVSEKSRGNPNAIKIRELCEGKTERKDVDAILEQFKVVHSNNEDYTAIKRRFERVKNTSLVEDQLKESGSRRGSPAGGDSVNDEMKDLFPGATLDQVESLM